MNNNKVIPITRMYQLYGFYCPDTDELRCIGITTGLLSTRLSGHLRNPTNGKIRYWFNCLKKENKTPIIKLICKYESYEELLQGEINEIKNKRNENYNLLNIADGGDINPMFGKTHTEEARKKISENNKGLKRTEKQKEIFRKNWKKLWLNDKWSSVVKKRMSENLKGNKLALGYKHTDKTKKTNI